MNTTPYVAREPDAHGPKIAANVPYCHRLGSHRFTCCGKAGPQQEQRHDGQ